MLWWKTRVYFVRLKDEFVQNANIVIIYSPCPLIESEVRFSGPQNIFRASPKHLK